MEVIQNHPDRIVLVSGQGGSMNRKNKRLKLGSGQAYDHPRDQLSFLRVQMS
jgi:hypothetical protein